MFGSLFRLAFDALLVSAFLAGVKRSTGLTYVLVSHFFRHTHLDASVLRYPKYLTRTFAVSTVFHSLLSHVSSSHRIAADISRVWYISSFILLLSSNRRNRRVCIRLCRSHLRGTPTCHRSHSRANHSRSVLPPSNAGSNLIGLLSSLVSYLTLYGHVTPCIMFDSGGPDRSWYTDVQRGLSEKVEYKKVEHDGTQCKISKCPVCAH